MNLQEMKVKELLEIAKELKITGRYDMKKGELIEAIEAAQTVEETEVEITEHEQDVNFQLIGNAYKNTTVEEVMEQYQTTTLLLEAPVEEEVKPKPRKNKRSIYLMNSNNEIIEEFESQASAIGFVVKEKYCNAGWGANSLKTGKSFYQKDDGTYTRPQKQTRYHGIGSRLVYKI